jgi:WD40 repeat protein
MYVGHEHRTMHKRLEGHTGWVLFVRFCFDGKQVMAGSRDNTLRMWDNAPWNNFI